MLLYPLGRLTPSKRGVTGTKITNHGHMLVLTVFVQPKSKTTEQVKVRLGGRMGNGPKMNPLNAGVEPGERYVLH